MNPSLRVLIVEDSEDDMLLVLRELRRGNYTLEWLRVETAAALETALTQQAWDIVIADYSLPTFSAPQALQLLQQHRLDLPFIIISGTIGEETAVQAMKAGAHDYLIKGNLTRLVPAVERELRDAEERQKRRHAEVERKQAEMALQQQLAREHLMVEITHSIRQTLDLDQILQRTVDQVRQFLKTDRVIIFRFQPDWQGQVITESVSADWNSILSMMIHDPCFDNHYMELYQQGHVSVITDLETSHITPCHRQLLKNLQVKANLVVPILQGDQLWGFLIAHHCVSARQWQSEEVELLKQLANQLGIAIQQSELYQQTRRELIERQQAEQTIREQAALLDITTDAICVRDLTHQILFWNKGAERLYGWTAAEVLGKNAFEILYRSEEDIPEFNTIQVTLMQQGQWQGELQNVTKAGKSVLVEGRWTLVRDEAGQPKSILTVSTDITEKKQLELQFLRAQRLESLGTLASGIAHDFNNILTPILAAAQLLPLTMSNLDERNHHLLQIIEDSTKRGADMVRQILSFARGMDGRRVPLQIRHLLSEVVQVARQTFPKSISIRTDIPTTGLWTVSADATQLHQVFMNLFVNARDAMPEGGRLNIVVGNQWVDEDFTCTHLEAHPGRYLVITIEDTGIGISDELLDRIFDPFFTTKDQGKGTGLGLSTALGILRNHGGFFQVESKVGKGTQFQVYLPATTDDTLMPLAEPTFTTGNQELILIVDDEPLIRQVAQTTLEEHNYRTLMASDGRIAIALYTQHQQEIRAVLMDMIMPSMGGISTIQTLQKLNPEVKIIATSGLISHSQLTQESGIEVSAFLPKPYTARELLTTLGNVLASKTEDDTLS